VTGTVLGRITLLVLGLCLAGLVALWTERGFAGIERDAQREHELQLQRERCPTPTWSPTWRLPWQ
jgi:hypothetical protein